MLNRIKAIIFDVDGVIVNSCDDQGHFLWSRHVKEDLGLQKVHFDRIFSEKWTDITRGKGNLQDHLHTLFQEPLFKDLGISPQTYIEYWLSHDCHINTEMLELITSLSIPCYLGTNQEALRTQSILNTVGRCFKGCFASYHIGFIKPESSFFHHIEQVLSLKPGQLLLIDDTKENVDSALNNGWRGYHYNGRLENAMEELKNFLQTQLHES